MIIGAQMFTVHDYTKTLEGFSESLKKIADIGYKSVQVSGTCEYDPHWLKEELAKNGLTCDLTHTNQTLILEDPQKVIDNHNIFDCKYIGIGCMPDIQNNTPETWKKFVNDYKASAEKFANAGKYFMYHNHNFEFIEKDGMIAMDYFASSFAPDIMGFTLDTHWVKAAGHDPVEWLEKLAGRTPCVHFKDLITMPDGKFRYAPVGTGELDFDAIIKTCDKNKVEYAFVEQDDCYDKDPFECLKISFDYLHSLGLC